METKEFAMAVSVGMNAAAHVALNAGHQAAYDCIIQYNEKWYSSVVPKDPRVMIAEDIYPTNGAARYAVAGDFL